MDSNCARRSNESRAPRRHLNKVSIQGKVISSVKWKELKSGTQSCVFKINSIETFHSRGKTNWHNNEIVVEALGAQAQRARQMIKKGHEYVFDGYLRSDTVHHRGVAKRRIRVRVFHIESF